jgi:hypothetical protein
MKYDSKYEDSNKTERIKSVVIRYQDNREADGGGR